MQLVNTLWSVYTANIKDAERIWKAVVDVPCNLQHVVIIQRVVGYTVRPQRPSIERTV